jgi:SPP1 family predicted phage head-tail adaptor
MQSGDLRHKIMLTPPGLATKDADGFNTPAGGTPVTTRAARENLGGTEGVEAARTTGKLTSKFTIRYRPGVNNHWKLAADGVTFDILSAIDVGSLHQWLEITAEAVT